MSSKILSLAEIDEIEARIAANNLTETDIRNLLQSVRGLLKGKRTRTTGTTRKKAEKEVAATGDLLPKGGPCDVVAIFSDGACEGNPGPGGWGSIICMGDHRREMSGGERRTTNNRMEMMAVIEPLAGLESPSKVVVTSDSQYLIKGMSTWIHGWKRNGWKTASKEPVKNKDLWIVLDELNLKHQIEWQWVRGHAGHPENERCDQLARDAIIKLNR